MPILPWKVLHSRTVIKDRWIDLRADSCQLPDGTPIDPFYVSRQPDFAVAVAVTQEGQFILVRQYRHGTRQILLELPAGCIEEADSDIPAAAARELLEETGYEGDPPRFLCRLAPNATSSSSFGHCYLITGCRRVREQKLDASEDMEVVLLTRQELTDLLRENGLLQAVHVAALFYAFQSPSLSQAAPPARTL